MSEDLISNNFVENVNKEMIKRNLRLVNILFVLVSIYILFDIADWYFTLKDINFAKTSARLIFSYRIRPVIAMVLLIISVLNVSWLCKANKLIDGSFEKKDADDFNAGYTLFNKSSYISIASYIISIISITIRIILKY